MGLNIFDFQQNVKPKVGFRFSVEFENELNKFSNQVKEITLPKFNINASDGRKRFGTTQIVLPVYTFADSEVEITFNETDNMDIISTLGSMMKWMVSVPTNFWITVREYDDTFNFVVRTIKIQLALYSYDQPKWSASEPSNLTVQAKFKVRDYYEDNSRHFLPLAVPSVDKDQVMNVIGDSTDKETMSNEEWEAFTKRSRERQKAPVADTQPAQGDNNGNNNAQPQAPTVTPNGQYFSQQTVNAKKDMAKSNDLAAKNNLSAISVEIAKKKLGKNASEADILAEAKRIDAQRRQNATAYNGLDNAYAKTWTYEYEMGSKLNDNGKLSQVGLRKTQSLNKEKKKWLEKGWIKESANGGWEWTQKGISEAGQQNGNVWLAERKATVGGAVYDGKDLGGDGKATGIDCSATASVIISDTTSVPIKNVAGGTSSIVDNAVKTGKYTKSNLDVSNLKEGDIVSKSGSHVVTVAYTEGDMIYTYESTGVTGTQVVAYSKKEFQNKYGNAKVASLNA